MAVGPWHLYHRHFKNEWFTVFTACGCDFADDARIGIATTTAPERVTCKRCMRTREYKCRMEIRRRS
jgi:hypothetical protein